MLTPSSLARCVDCGLHVSGAHVCAEPREVPESNFERHVRFVARGRLIRRLAREAR